RTADRPRALLPGEYPALLRRVHLCRAHRRHQLPQSLLPGLATIAASVRAAAAPRLVARRAPTPRAAQRAAATLAAPSPPLSDRGGLRVRRRGEARARLAAARAAAQPVVRRPHRDSDHRLMARSRLGGLRGELGGGVLRLHHRLLAVVAPHPPSGL